MACPADPLVSVIIIIASDTNDHRAGISYLAGTLEALERQIDPPPLEVIVPYHRLTEGIGGLRDRFPVVVFLPAYDLRSFTGKGGDREHHDELRSRGILAARGRIVALLEDHERPDPQWCRRLVDKHRRDYVAVGGAIENGVDRALNWAVYFCDSGRYQNPVPDGESTFASDANVSYKRAALEAIRPVWEESFIEPAVNGALRAKGWKIALSPDLVVYQHRQLEILGALRERFIWGRSFGTARSRMTGRGWRLCYAALSPAIPVLVLFRMIRNVMEKRRLRAEFWRAFPITALLTLSWSAGELAGNLRPIAHSGGGMGTRPGHVAQVASRRKVCQGSVKALK
jgi:hypothetical protein